jgi:hypothetical protein
VRQKAGVSILAATVLYYALDLLGWLRPFFLRMRANAGARRTIAIVLGSLTFKAVILIVGILLAFWPERARSQKT